MKVVFIPDYRSDNSYQTNLSNSLSKKDVSIYFNHGGFFSIIRSVIKCWKPDILHIHWTRSFMIADNRLMTVIRSTSFICELLLLKIFRIKIVWTVHNLVDHEAKFQSIELLFTKIFAKLCDTLIVHCNNVKKLVKDTYGDNLRVEVVPHGNYSELKNVISLQDARNRLNIEMEDFIFLYFGRIRQYKGLPELIYAFKKLNVQNAKMLIIGNPFTDEIANHIKNICNDDVRIRHILEFIPDDEIQIYMNAADIVVLPFRDILTSGSVILSMSFGKPIIAPEIGCITDILDDNGSFLYTEDLFETMNRALNTDRKIIKDMGEHNFRLARQLGWDEIAKKTYNIYQNALINSGNNQ